MPEKKRSNSNIYFIGSLYQWAFVSYLIVILPLVLAIIYTIIEVDNYTQKSQKTLFQRVNVTDGSRIIVDSLTSMERNIKQFQVTNETEYYSYYLDNRKKFIDILLSLKATALAPNLVKSLNTLQQNEIGLYQKILDNSELNQQKLSAEDSVIFDQLTKQAKLLLVESEKRVEIEAMSLSEIAKRVKQIPFYAALASIPLAIIFTFILVYFLTRPIRDIGQAIRNLGDDGFKQPIKIKGPYDLTELGDHLDWLRLKLKRLENDKKQFIRNVSHELKTPLATLKEGTDLLSENLVGELNTEQQDIVQMMKISNINLNNLIDNLLSYQQALSTQVELNFSTFDLKTLIKRIIFEYRLPLRRKEIILKGNLSSVPIIADYDKFKSIISNIFSNALKFSPNSGTICLTLSTRDNLMFLMIEDQGPGIPKELQSLIFQDFYQGTPPEEWKIKGSGLGLALVRHFLKVHKGSIKLLNPSDKYGGARFLLQLPLSMDV